jgi:hypothetical protein
MVGILSTRHGAALTDIVITIITIIRQPSNFWENLRVGKRRRRGRVSRFSVVVHARGGSTK